MPEEAADRTPGPKKRNGKLHLRGSESPHWLRGPVVGSSPPTKKVLLADLLNEAQISPGYMLIPPYFVLMLGWGVLQGWAMRPQSALYIPLFGS